MKTVLAAAALVCASAPLSFAQETSPGRDMAVTMFESLDQGDRGYLDMGQVSNFSGDVFVSMDVNDDGKVDLDEFMAWDIGMRQVAEDRDAVPAFEAALRVVHAVWDRDGDGAVTRSEHRQAVLFDFQRADQNNDAILDQGEFLGGFLINMAARAALAPHLR